MNIKLTILAAILFSISINAQNFQGKAIYKTSLKSSIEIGVEKSTMNDKMYREIQERLRKMSQKTYILEFDKEVSTYKEDVKLNVTKPQTSGLRVMTFGGAGSTDIFYKNIKEKRFVNQTEIMGKRFLVKDDLINFDWELSSETKNIGNYTCYKATFSKEEDKKNISMVEGKVKEITEKVTVITTAWYTLEIPVSNGPKNYQGLPGLILEINDGTTTIVCTEIVLNPLKKIEIIAPQKGKVLSQEKFNKIREEKTKEMMERFRSKSGNGMEIRIGG